MQWRFALCRLGKRRNTAPELAQPFVVVPLRGLLRRPSVCRPLSLPLTETRLLRSTCSSLLVVPLRAIVVVVATRARTVVRVARRR